MGKKERETGHVKTNGAQRDFGGGGEKVTEAVLGL